MPRDELDGGCRVSSNLQFVARSCKAPVGDFWQRPSVTCARDIERDDLCRGRVEFGSDKKSNAWETFTRIL